MILFNFKIEKKNKIQNNAQSQHMPGLKQAYQHILSALYRPPRTPLTANKNHEHQDTQINGTKTCLAVQDPSTIYTS